jgi:hypothetical protein
MLSDIEATSTGLLTRRELEWLLGKTGSISKSFEYKIKSSLRKKVQGFVELELPLLLEKRRVMADKYRTRIRSRLFLTYLSSYK